MPANASVTVWIVKCAAAPPEITGLFRLEGPAVDIFSMSHLHYNYHKYHKFILINTVNNSVHTVTYTIPVVAG
jgi:hypothetical protein